MTKAWATLAGLFALALPVLAVADTLGQPVVTLPSTGLSGDASGTVAVTNTFQLVWPAPSSSQPRKGCLLVNTAVTVELVYFGPVPVAAGAVPLNPAGTAGQAGGAVSCIVGSGTVSEDAVWITGTTGAAYVAKQQ